MKHLLPEMSFNKNEFSPVISEETIDFHYNKHLNGYINNLNNLIIGTEFEEMTLEEIVLKSSGSIFNNAAQSWNHIFYFNQFTGNTNFSNDLNILKQIEKDFGNFEEFKAQMISKSVGNFGSGWTWLVLNNNKLEIVNTSNAGCVITMSLKPIFVIDVWEHAYYIDYRNNRALHIEKLFDIINWKVLEDRYLN